MSAASDSCAPPASVLRILVVEDDEDSREMMADVLHANGDHDVTLANNAEDGLRLLRCEAYDLVVTDIDLPDVSGFVMLDQAKAEGRLAETAVVVCSTDPWLRRRALDRGATFIPKPVAVGRMFEMIRRIRPREE